MRLILLASGAALGLTLAACNPAAPPPPAADATPVAAPTPAENAPAPAGSALPSAPPARVAWAPPARRYHYLDEAYQESQAYADAPPDYAFDYDDNAPEAWGGGDGIVRVGERVPGGWRYYYYRPGSDQPYLVRDPDYAYGYDGGVLTVVYDSRGRALDEAVAQRQADLAGRYYARAQALRRAATANQRHEVGEQVWRDQRAEQDRQRQVWTQARQSDPDWRSYSRTAPQPQWGAIAAAWAARQPAAPPNAGPVADARNAWRARVAPNAPSAPPAPVAPVATAPVGGPEPRGPGEAHDHRPTGGPAAPATAVGPTPGAGQGEAGHVEGAPHRPVPDTPPPAHGTGTGGPGPHDHRSDHPAGGAPATAAPTPPPHARDAKPAPAVVSPPAAPTVVHPAPRVQAPPPPRPVIKPAVVANPAAPAPHTPPPPPAVKPTPPDEKKKPPQDRQ
jgi:hypothetical protein